MLQRFHFVCIVFLATFLFSAAVQAEIYTDTEVLLNTPTESPQPLILPSGEAAVTIFAPDGTFLLKRLDGHAGQLKISDYASPDVKNSFNGAVSRQGNLYFVWRPKLSSNLKDGRRGDKHVMFRASYDGGKTLAKAVRLDSANGAFYPRLFTEGANRLYTVWFDEREGGSRFGIYFNRSTDQGRHWLKHDMKMNAGSASTIDPVLASEGKHVWLGWVENSDKGRAKQYLKIRYSEDSGTNWNKETRVPLPEGQVVRPEMVFIDGRLLIFYYNPKMGILMVQSKDGGKHWAAPVVLPETDEFGSIGFQIGSSKKGDICLVWPGPYNLKGKKADIYASCSHDYGRSWDHLHRLDTNTPRLTHSMVPSMAMDDEGNVAVVWQDVRNMRPERYLNYSTDGGRHWLVQDIRMADGRESHDFTQFARVISRGEGRFLMAWEHLNQVDGQPLGFVLAYEDFKLGKCVKLLAGKRRQICPQAEKKMDSSGLDPRQARLLKRVKQFWQAMVKDDLGAVYDMYDPFYQQMTRRDLFLKRGIDLSYERFSIPKKAVNIIENRAAVKVDLTIAAGDIQVGMQTMTIPQTRKVVNDQWIWMDGDWFKVYTIKGDKDFLPQF